MLLDMLKVMEIRQQDYSDVEEGNRHSTGERYRQIRDAQQHEKKSVSSKPCSDPKYSQTVGEKESTDYLSVETNVEHGESSSSEGRTERWWTKEEMSCPGKEELNHPHPQVTRVERGELDTLESQLSVCVVESLVFSSRLHLLMTCFFHMHSDLLTGSNCVSVTVNHSEDA